MVLFPPVGCLRALLFVGLDSSFKIHQHSLYCKRFGVRNIVNKFGRKSQVQFGKNLDVEGVPIVYFSLKGTAGGIVMNVHELRIVVRYQFSH